MIISDALPPNLLLNRPNQGEGYEKWQPDDIFQHIRRAPSAIWENLRSNTTRQTNAAVVYAVGKSNLYSALLFSYKKKDDLFLHKQKGFLHIEKIKLAI